MPVEISTDVAIPDDGIQLTRTYDRPLAEAESATWAFWDEDLGTWHAVPSEVSADRLSVTAVVHHLSLWTDVVGAVSGAITAAADWTFYQVGKVFDVRVDPPECTDGEPGWVDEVVSIDQRRNDPILFCTGHDAKDPELLVVKARVNRGFAYSIDAPGEHAWTYNSTGEGGDLDSALASVGNLGGTIAESLASLVQGEGFVAAGQELSLGLTAEQVRALDDGRVLTLRPPDALGFLLSVLGQLIGAEIGLVSGGYAGAVIAIAGCSQAVREADDGGTWARALKECVGSLDEAVATRLGGFLAQQGMGAAKAGKVAGHVVGRLSVYLALVGPVFSTMNYLAERATSDAARTVSVFPGAVSGVTAADLLSAEVPADCDLPAQRLVNGGATQGSPGEGMVAADGQGLVGYGDLAGLGYDQALVPYWCTAGGVSWPETLLLVGRGGALLASYDLGQIGGMEHASTQSVTVSGSSAVVEWQAYEGAGLAVTTHRSVVTYADGALVLQDTITAWDAAATLAAVLAALSDGSRTGLVDQAVIDDPTWSALVQLAAGQGGVGSWCDDPVDGRTVCEMILPADYGGGYSAVLEPADNAYGWRVTAVGGGVGD